MTKKAWFDASDIVDEIESDHREDAFHAGIGADDVLDLFDDRPVRLIEAPSGRRRAAKIAP